MNYSLALGALAVSIVTAASVGTPVQTVEQPASAVATPATQAESSATQTGQAVFESLFFLQGGSRTVALLKNAGISSYTDAEIADVLASVNTPKSIELVHRIETELVARNSDYFRTLGSAVESKDPAVLQRALEESYSEMLATPAMKEATTALDTKKSYVPGEIGTDCGVAVVVALGVAIAVTAVAVVNYGLAVNIALGANVAAGVNKVYQRSAPQAQEGERFSPAVVAGVMDEFAA